MDKKEITLFIEYQFMRLGMFNRTHTDEKNYFISMIDNPNRSKWWLLCCVVDFVEQKYHEYYDWCNRI
jgi:hypothetical protein